ncbi:MAG: flagellar protein FlgN [Planctomycetes bacterium]|nr:flagellar protein FlgN [Planctomycetota bacterium]
MEKEIERLAEILKAHTERHEQLLRLADEKRQALIQNNADLVNEITENESNLILAVQEAEKERLACVEAIGREYELRETPTLEAISDLDKGIAEVLEPLRRQLTAVLERLRYRTQQNAMLLCHGIGHVVGFFQTIADARTTPATYCRVGRAYGEQLHMVDHKA